MSSEPINSESAHSSQHSSDLECFRALVGAMVTHKAAEKLDSEADPASSSAVSTKPEASESRPLKRPRDIAETSSSSDAEPSSSSPSDSSKTDSDASPSPSKRAKRRSGDETPDSTPEPALALKKKVRFHPATIDNSLWADLDEMKYGRKNNSDDGFPSDATQDGSSESASLTLVETSSTPPSSPTPDPASSNDASKVPTLKQTKPRRQLSRERAKEFLIEMTWSNKFVFIDRTSDDPPDPDDETVSSHLTSDEDWPQHDCDDVSIPRSSPPPSVRIMAMNVSAAEANSYKADMDAKRKEDAKVELPSIYMPPIRSKLGTFDGQPSSRPMTEDSELPVPKPLPTSEQLSRYAQTLMDAFNKLCARDARAASEALEMITRCQNKQSYEAGFREGLRSQLTTQSQEKKAAAP